jgi:cyclopropane fatty-acyl-phospholipid synthase-like methyltransferase
VLEPGCGSGRYLEAFARHGLEVVGIDSSPVMVEFARTRLANSSLPGEVVLGDMADFDLGGCFDGAIATIQHLTREELGRHLLCMGRHLAEDSRYIVQLALYEPSGRQDLPSSSWEESRGDLSLRIDWTTEKVDPAAGCALQRSRIEILAGPRQGLVVVEGHEMTAWTPETWGAAIAGSRFAIDRVFDGAEEPPVLVEEQATGGLIWHELRREACRY